MVLDSIKSVNPSKFFRHRKSKIFSAVHIKKARSNYVGQITINTMLTYTVVMEILFLCAPFVFPALVVCLHLKHTAQNRRAMPKAPSFNGPDPKAPAHLEMESAKAQFADVIGRLARIEAKVDLVPNKAMQSN